MLLLTNKCTSSTLIILSTIASLQVHSVSAQELPSLRVGMEYEDAHQALLDSGWQPVGSNIMYCMGGELQFIKNGACKAGFTNVQDCTGGGYCSYLWRNALGTRLSTVSFGGRSSYDGTLASWQFE